MLQVLVVVVLVGLQPGGPGADGCIVYPDRTVDCTQRDAPQEGGANWDALDVALTVGTILASVLASAAGVVIVRRRRRAVGTYLKRLEASFTRSKEDPAVGLQDLLALREEINARYQQGRLEDAPFLDLLRRIGHYLARVRMANLHQVAPSLPPKVTDVVLRCVEDGVVTVSDLQRIEEQARRSRVPAATRAQLMALVDSWSKQDEAIAP